MHDDFRCPIQSPKIFNYEKQELESKTHYENYETTNRNN